MESFFSRFKNALVLIALLLTQTIALATQINRPLDPLHPDGRQVRLLRLWAIAMMYPVERMSTATGAGVRGLWADYVGLRSVRRENADLKRQLDKLRLERAAMAEDALEGQRLRGLLGFRQQYVGKTVAAQVIGTSGSDQSRLLTLDKGSHDGLKPDMAVITPNGIVGKLRDVFPFTSQLLLIDDATSGAGVILASTRIHAILRGSPQGRVLINNLTPDSRIQRGETVLTSGGDGVFPRGLPVGTIESIALDPERQPFTSIVVRPAANLQQLDEVLIVTSEGASSADQADDIDTATHAADVSAERLPSLHKDAAAAIMPNGAPAPPPNDATSLVPKAQPALHPDRYSPAATPPAEELTPGAPKDRDQGPGLRDQEMGR